MKRIKLFESFIKETAISLPEPRTAGRLFAGVLAGNKDIKEAPKGSNTGAMVNQYLSSVGLKPGLPWCAAFVYYIFDQVTKKLGVKNQLPKTGGVMNMWNSSDPALKISIKEAKANPSLIKPGQIFILTRPGKNLGHTGIIVDVDVNKREFVAIEGNTNDQQSGEGDRVGLNRRSIDRLPLVGFIDYFKGVRTPEFEKEIMTVIGKSRIPVSPLNNTPPDAVVSGHKDIKIDPTDASGDEDTETKPAGFISNVLSGLTKTLGGLAEPDEIEAQLSKLR
jgi:hypothetical protein